MDFCCFNCCWLLLPLRDSVIFLCFVVRYFVSILALQSSLVALLCLSCWCLIIVVWLFLTVPSVCLQFVIVVFPDHTHYFWWNSKLVSNILLLVAYVLNISFTADSTKESYFCVMTSFFSLPYPSKVVVLLLLICCVLALPLFIWILHLVLILKNST